MIWAGVFCGPFLVALALFYLWPVARSIYLSFTETGYFGGSTWAGLSNYERLAVDQEFWAAMKNSVIYSGIIILGIPIAIAIAGLMNQRGLRYVSFYRALFFLPVITMPTAIALVWKSIFHGDYGALNQILRGLGLQGAHWLTDPKFALYAIGIVGVWHGIGVQIVIFYAGLQDVPSEYYEAADMDGAGRIEQFIHITVPLITPSIFFVTIISVISSLQVFDLLYVMLGPVNPATPDVQTVVYYFFDQTFINHDSGYGSAVAISLMAVTLGLTWIQFKLQRRWVHYA